MKAGIYSEMINMSTYCPRLWKEAFIKEVGEVYACCHQQPKKLGNIYKQSLADIFNNNIWQAMRRKPSVG